MNNPGDRIIVECWFAVAEPPPENEVARLHAGLCQAIDMPAYRVAGMAYGPGMMFWMLLGATMEQVHGAEDWLAEHSSPLLQHTVMYHALPGKPAP